MDNIAIAGQVFRLYRHTAPQALFSSGSCTNGSLRMPEPTEEDIKRRAYELWQEAGCPKDRDSDFYHLAEQELRNEDRSNPLRTPDNL